MINDLFLKKAVEIRKEYLKITKDIESYERSIRDLLKLIENSSNDLSDFMEKLNNNKIVSSENAKNDLLKIILNLENEYNNNEKQINLLNEGVENLKKSELNLFKEIKQRYSDISDSDIKKEVQEYIAKLNLS